VEDPPSDIRRGASSYRRSTFPDVKLASPLLTATLLLSLLRVQVVCEQLKVQSQNDTAKLAEAKQMVYLKVRTALSCYITCY
jgi:hypothetical protein